MKRPFDHFGIKPTKEELDEAREQYSDFSESKEGIRFLRAHGDVRRKFGDGIATMASTDLALAGFCDFVISLYKKRFGIDDPNELIKNSSYKHAMEQDLKEMVVGLLPGRFEETVANYGRVDEQGND